jgi:hypothetical protein
MDLMKIIGELREEQEMLSRVIESLEGLQAMRLERHGLPPKARQEMETGAPRGRKTDSPAARDRSK